MAHVLIVARKQVSIGPDLPVLLPARGAALRQDCMPILYQDTMGAVGDSAVLMCCWLPAQHPRWSAGDN